MSIHLPIGSIALPTLLGRLDTELAGCETILSRIEAICEALLHPGPGTQSAGLDIAEAQAIDLLSQTLGDLRICLRGLKSSPPVQASLPIFLDPVLQGVKLDDLRQRLSGRTGRASPAGSFDLF